MFERKERKKLEVEDCYQVLGIKENASILEIEMAYRKKTLTLHPDKNPDKDTTIFMQELNEAREILVQFVEKEKSRIKVGIDSQQFFFHKEKDNIYIQEQEWQLNYNLINLFICHSKFQGGKDNITFWKLSTKPSVTLPINFDDALYQKLRLLLIPLIPYSSEWLCDNQVEIGFMLPKDPKLLNTVLTIIFDIYKMPDSIINFIKDIMEYRFGNLHMPSRGF